MITTQANEFTAPEVLGSSGSTLDALKVDEYAVGVVLYHLLTRSYPYKFTKHKSDQETYQELI